MRAPSDSYREYEQWLNHLSLDDIVALFRENKATQLFCKALQRNNNSKQQVYVGSDISELSWIPTGHIQPVESASEKGTGRSGPIFQLSVNLCWITPSGVLEPAKAAKLIAYPQYPEVRFSGFLSGTRQAPSFLFNIEQRGHDADRLLFLAPRNDGVLVALCIPPESAAAREFMQMNFQDRSGVFVKIPLNDKLMRSGLDLLLFELCRIHRLSWIPSRLLGSNGVMRACNGSNCGGYTLEAQLGIRANGISEPDFEGWEIKARTVQDTARPGVSRVTLFTPEPDGGFYASEGAKAFIRRWGYPDKHAREDRINFGGIYRCGGDFNTSTQVKMILDGYDASRQTFVATGALRLIDTRGNEAASWSFAKLMGHWKRKHAQAAYVPCQGRVTPAREYRYGDSILLGEGTEFRLFLKTLAEGVIYYDPGIKLENASSEQSKQKLRSQIRVSSRDLSLLYTHTRTMDACGRKSG